MDERFLIIALVIIVPAALLWTIFLVRTGRTGRPRVVIGIPQAMRPAAPDEALETRRLERIQVWSLVSILATAIFIPVYWLPEGPRQSSFEERFHEESVTRGKFIFAKPPVLEEDTPAAEFKELEKGIALGQGCANCHGGDASGGLAAPPFADPATGTALAYSAPPLNNVFQRWDDEVVRFTIERGRPGTPMPAWGVEFGGSMTDLMIDDVMNYLKTLPGNNEPPGELSDGCQDPAPEDYVSCGKEIFEARCAVCHGIDGQGKEGLGTGPNPEAGTTGDPWFQGMALWKGDVKHLPRYLHVTTVVNGRRFAFMPAFGEAPSQGVPVPPYPLSDAQIEAVVEYERNEL